MKKVWILVGLLAWIPSAWSQQEPLLNMSFQNKLVYNPAYAGSRGQLSFMGGGRRQWVGFEGAPQQEAFSLHLPTSDGRNGLGATVVSDRNMYSSRVSCAGNYAYRIPIGKAHLAMGLRLGLANYRLRTTEIDVWDNGDPAFESTLGDFSKWMAVAGTGLYLQHPRFYFGASIPDLLPHKLYDTYYEELTAQSRWHHYFMAGLSLPLGNHVFFRPNAMLRVVKGAPTSLDLNAGFWFYRSVSVAASWRPGQAVAFQTELYVDQGLRLGYSYDYPIGQTRSLGGAAHELFVGFDLSLFTQKGTREEAFIH